MNDSFHDISKTPTKSLNDSFDMLETITAPLNMPEGIRIASQKPFLEFES